MWQLHWRYTLWPHITSLGGGFKYLSFSPLSLGKWSNLTSIFFISGVFNHHLDQPSSMINNRTQLTIDTKTLQPNLRLFTPKSCPEATVMSAEISIKSKTLRRLEVGEAAIKDCHRSESCGTKGNLLWSCFCWVIRHGFLAPHCSEKHFFGNFAWFLSNHLL